MVEAERVHVLASWKSNLFRPLCHVDQPHVMLRELPAFHNRDIVSLKVQG